MDAEIEKSGKGKDGGDCPPPLAKLPTPATAYSVAVFALSLYQAITLQTFHVQQIAALRSTFRNWLPGEAYTQTRSQKNATGGGLCPRHGWIESLPPPTLEVREYYPRKISRFCVQNLAILCILARYCYRKISLHLYIMHVHRHNFCTLSVRSSGLGVDIILNISPDNLVIRWNIIMRTPNVHTTCMAIKICNDHPAIGLSYHAGTVQMEIVNYDSTSPHQSPVNIFSSHTIGLLPGPILFSELWECVPPTTNVKFVNNTKMTY